MLIVSAVGASWWFLSLGTSGSHLRSLYATQPENWPQPTLDAGVELDELGSLPPAQSVDDELADLGKHLFFDPRLSKSGRFPVHLVMIRNWLGRMVGVLLLVMTGTR